MVLIAVDPHKSSHTALAVDEANDTEQGLRRVAATEPQELLRWARHWDERRWAVEGARGVGRGLAQWLVAEGWRSGWWPRARRWLTCRRARSPGCDC